MACAQLQFKGAPLPPSSNSQYRSFFKGGKVRHVSAPELVAFKKAMDFYFLENMELVKFAREALVGNPLAIHVDFGFEKSRILTKKGTLKRLDVSNRLKAIHDAFASALLIDDCVFIEISARKYAVNKKEDEGAQVVIRLCDFVEVLDSGILKSPTH